MPLTDETLFSMVGRVQDARPGAGDSRYRQWINDAVRHVINKRPYWTDLRKSGIVSVPSQTNTGTVSTATGSNVINGSGMTWPTNDVTSTTLAEPVVLPGGFNEVQITNISTIQPDAVLYIDGGSPFAEAVPVNLVKGQSIVGRFQYPHNAGATVTQSSLVGQQFRTGYEFPIFTVMAVPTPTSLIIDVPWGGPPLTNWFYYILGMYFSVLASSANQNIRKIVAAVDQQQGIPLDCQMTQEELNIRDAQRSDNSDPLAFVSRGPSAAGFMQWEIYPAPTSGRQIAFLCSLQWPKMIDDDSIPPYFIEPTIFTDKAISVALATRLSKDDAFYDLKSAAYYKGLAEEGIKAAINADEYMAAQDYSNQYANLFAPGQNSMFALKHAGYEQLDGWF